MAPMLRAPSTARANVAGGRRLQTSFRRAGRTGRQLTVTPQAAIKTGGENVVTVRATWKDSLYVNQGTAAGTDLNTYLSLSPQFIPNYELPLGAKLTPSGTGMYIMDVPKLEFFDVWIQPVADTMLTAGPGRIDVTCNDASISGSSHVKDLGLDERFQVQVDVAFFNDNGRLGASADLTLDVDVPSPFNLMPGAVLETTGSGVMQVVVVALMSTFGSSMVQDYNLWASNADVRASRQ